MERIDPIEDECGNRDCGGVQDELGATSGSDSIHTAFLRCKHDACLAVEMAAEEETLDGAAWLALKQRLNQLAGTAGYFGAPELGLLARDLEHGLDILSPRGRARRLRNARMEFLRLAASCDG